MTTRHPDGRQETRTLTEDEAEGIGWFDGPPYVVAEYVFDEEGREDCTLTREERSEDDRPLVSPRRSG